MALLRLRFDFVQKTFKFVFAAECLQFISLSSKNEIFQIQSLST